MYNMHLEGSPPLHIVHNYKFSSQLTFGQPTAQGTQVPHMCTAHYSTALCSITGTVQQDASTAALNSAEMWSAFKDQRESMCSLEPAFAFQTAPRCVV